ncbi:MAG: RNA polymerase sigma factor, partial [Actinobacteria bacterium]|nr:RNA polymerase sigma factor [Actinomycetota bacterium]
LHVARGIGGFVGDECAFRSWVFVIAHRRLSDARRRASRRPVTVPLVDDGYVEDQAVVTGADHVAAHLAADEVVRAFERLSEAQRDILALRLIADLTLEETARVLGKRVGAVKWGRPARTTPQPARATSPPGLTAKARCSPPTGW